jgi:hypothetical protein
MSDDDDVQYVKKPRTIHYGSLEDAERARLAAADGNDDSNEKAEGVSANPPQVHISTGILVYKFISALLPKCSAVSNSTLKNFA